VPSEAAPGALELVRALLNTVDLEQGADQLTGAREWLGMPVAPRDVRRLVDLRETLRDALDPAQPHRAEALDRLNALLRSARAHPRLGPDTRLTVAFPQASGLTAVLGAVVTASVDGTLRRLKICANPECRWAFYDPSRNVSGRWCDMAACGNREKVRRYRRRHTG
jgi:predicted RNA-binding Zn ribbon-like protein